ncbi:N-acetylglucosaminyl deacetylase, LmbE family [Granulicella rosea]|uniref:N-acetylglucosaminyl deacetylase, LmbE family n=1 Tax=Granulicella rosea TaxID=474952 RepID=A0A239MN76_9BACT|nr:PIG-L family deacetylase [Granulicella rosea]SNT44181.1 N-acetylglucosaminyl deacetylase, LmbE family [Granulicella rosea]
MDLYVISPHRDDAAFSLSIAMRHWLGRGHRVQIVNIFTRSLYAPYADVESIREEDRVNYVSGLRRMEDESFLKVMHGATKFDLDLDDSPIRLGCHSSEVCATLETGTDAALPAIRGHLQRLLHQEDVALVLPLALGRHVDHCIARNAALPLVPYLPCAFYEDLPYATRQGARADLDEVRRRLIEEHRTSLTPVLCHDAGIDPIGFKRANAGLYSSQIRAEEAQPIAEFSRRYGGGERLWANAKWLAAAEALSLSTNQVDPQGYPLPA